MPSETEFPDPWFRHRRDILAYVYVIITWYLPWIVLWIRELK